MRMSNNNSNNNTTPNSSHPPPPKANNATTPPKAIVPSSQFIPSPTTPTIPTNYELAYHHHLIQMGQFYNPAELSHYSAAALAIRGGGTTSNPINSRTPLINGHNHNNEASSAGVVGNWNPGGILSPFEYNHFNTPQAQQNGLDLVANSNWPIDNINNINGGGVIMRNQPRQATGNKPSNKKPRRRVASVAQRRAANIRERRRMFSLNEGFDKLRRKVPTFAYEKRLSRIETLRLAVTYISFMGDLLAAPPGEFKLNHLNKKYVGSNSSFEERNNPIIQLNEGVSNNHHHHHHQNHNNNILVDNINISGANNSSSGGNSESQQRGGGGIYPLISGGTSGGGVNASAHHGNLYSPHLNHLNHGHTHGNHHYNN